MPAAFLATMLALPVNAGITVPDEPLTTGARVPPNLLFVLDNSGSMESTSMPDVVLSVTSPVPGIDIRYETPVRNSIYYNPAFDYRP